MKTPKHLYKTPANQLAQDIEPDFFEADYHVQEARWKRKNRIAQLKHTIARQNRIIAALKRENSQLWQDLYNLATAPKR